MFIHNKMRALAGLTLCLCMSAFQAEGAEPMYRPERATPSAGAMAVDIIAVRPLGVAATLLGTGLFVVSLPFSALGGNVGEAADTLVKTPAKFTFTRPLGEYDAYR